VIIYGWGKQTRRTHGVVGTDKCTHCGATVDFHLVQVRTWFTLFWIPLIPYRSEHRVLCSGCEWGWSPTAAEVAQLKTGIQGILAAPRSAPAITESAASPWHPGDLVTPKSGSALRDHPGGVADASADRTSPSVVLAVRESAIQVRDGAGRIGWLRAGDVE
jgi:hypothetical protein